MLRTEVPGIAQETSDVRRVEGMYFTALVIIAMVGGLAFSGCALAARVGSFPRNRWAGFMAGATRSSEEARRAGHRAAWLPMFLGGLSLAVCGLAAVADRVLDVAAAGTVAIGCLVVFLLTMLPGAAIAQRAASRVRDRRG